LLRKPFPRLSQLDIKHCGAAIENLIIKVGFVARLCLAKVQRMGLDSAYLTLLKLCIDYADSGQPQGLSLRTVRNRPSDNFLPLSRQRCVEVTAPYKCMPIKL